MSEIRVIIKDFRIIENAKLIIDGIVGVVGESNHGKTALYNSIKTLCYNILGDSYIRQGSDGVIVGMAFVDGDRKDEIIFQKVDSPSYKLNGKPYIKVGRTIPDEIRDIINMSLLEIDDLKVNLNFLDQLQAPLLLGLSDVQLYNVTIKSFDGEKINEAIKLAKKDIDEYRNNIKEKNIKLNVQKENRLVQLDKLEVYKKLSKIKDEYLAYEVEHTREPVIKGFLDKRKGLKTNIQKTINILKELVLILELEKQLKTAVEIKTRLQTLEVAENDRQSIKTRLQTLEKEEKEYAKLKAILPGYDLVKAASEKQVVLTFHKYKREQLISNQEITQNIYNETVEMLEHLEIQVKGGFTICSYCNQKIEKPNDMEFAQIKTKVENLKVKKAELEGKKKEQESQLENLDKDIKEAGWNPEDLLGEIEKSKIRITQFENKVSPIIEDIEKSLATPVTPSNTGFD